MEKNYEFHFRLEIDLNSYFHATWALREDFENIDSFDHIFTSLLSIFRRLKVGMTPLGRKFES